MSLFRNIFQLGLPLGCTFLTVALIETNILFYAYLIDFAQLPGLFTTTGHGFREFTFLRIVELFIFPLYKTITTFGFLWIGTIFKGSWKMLLAWIASSIFFHLFITINGLYSIIFQSFNGVLLYNLLIHTCLFTYQMLIAIWVYQEAIKTQVLQPLGKGLGYIWTYLCNELQTAAQFFLVSEMMIDGFYLLSRQLVTHAFGLQYHYGAESWDPAAVTEQLVMTGIRFVLDAIALYCVIKEKKNWIKVWCVGAGIQILLSAVLFVLFSILWMGEYKVASPFTGIIMFPAHLIFRFIVLFFCLRYIRIDFSSMVL